VPPADTKPSVAKLHSALAIALSYFLTGQAPPTIAWAIPVLAFFISRPSQWSAPMAGIS